MPATAPPRCASTSTSSACSIVSSASRRVLPPVRPERPPPTSTTASPNCSPNWLGSRTARVNCSQSSPPPVDRRDGRQAAKCDMSPDDVSAVQRSWAELRRVRSSLITQLVAQYDRAASPSALLPDLRAAWLYVAVDELVDLLPAPSVLAARA